MYGYELVKRNKCIITIGASAERGVKQVVTKLRRRSEDKAATQDDYIDRTNAPPEEAKITRPEVKVPCYFLNVPKIQLKSSFTPQTDLLSRLAAPALKLAALADNAGPAMMGVFDEKDGQMARARAISQNLSSSHQDGQGTKSQFTDTKVQETLGNLTALFDSVTDAATVEGRAFAQGQVLQWAGQQPTHFSVDVIFCKPDNGVHMGVLYPLMEASGFSGLTFGNQLWGPRGFNNAGLGFNAIKKILNGEFKTLHSLEMWFDSEDEFVTNRSFQRRTKILQLFRLLVIESISIERSEQLFFNPSAPDAPLYKWIKATINFATACPIPGSVFHQNSNADEKLSHIIGPASAHDFFGERSVWLEPQYLNPIRDMGTEGQGVNDFLTAMEGAS